MEAKTATMVHLGLGRSILVGLLVGLIGSLVMGGLAYLAPTPTHGAPFFVAPFTKMGLSGVQAYAAGWLLEVLVGLVIGAVYAILAARFERLKANKAGWGIVWGLVAGIAAWLVFGLPALAYSGALASAALAALVLGFTVVYGIILGAGYAAASARLKSGERRQTVSS